MLPLEALRGAGRTNWGQRQPFLTTRGRGWGILPPEATPGAGIIIWAEWQRQLSLHNPQLGGGGRARKPSMYPLVNS